MACIFNFSGEIRLVKDAVDYLKTLFPDTSYTMGGKAIWAPRYLKTDLIREELGFVPRYSMERGIRESIDRMLGR